MTVELIDKYPVPTSALNEFVNKAAGIQEGKSANYTDMFTVVIVTFNEPLLEKT